MKFGTVRIVVFGLVADRCAKLAFLILVLFFWSLWVDQPSVCASYVLPLLMDGPCDPVAPRVRISNEEYSSSCRLRKINGRRCFRRSRVKNHYCDDLTSAQIEYRENVMAGRLDVLEFLIQEIDQDSEMNLCPKEGVFLANGYEVMPTEQNHLYVQSRNRCRNFATLGMATLLEWLGRQVTEKFSGAHLVIGDISSPKGGCLRGHASHEFGLDVDIGFIKKGGDRQTQFFRQFDPSVNWSFLKMIIQNPCVFVTDIFLDPRHKQILKRKFLRGDPDWKRYESIFLGVRGHHNHFHVRIKDQEMKPGCLLSLIPGILL